MSRFLLFLVSLYLVVCPLCSFLVPHDAAGTRRNDHHQKHRESFLELGAAVSDRYNGPPLRVVRCFPHLSRREAERAVLDGRVRVDGEIVAASYRLVGGQSLTLDHKKIVWEPQANVVRQHSGTIPSNQQRQTQQQQQQQKHKESLSSPLRYYKYYKPIGVTCTMDKHDRRGMWYALPSKLTSKRLKNHRLFPVGRLDLDSEGLVLLTNDGILADALLQPKHKHEKEYVVSVRPGLTSNDINELASGVEITTVQQRGGHETTAPTLPCIVEPLYDDKRDQEKLHASTLRIVLCEGRNRQIRRMVSAVGSEVVALKRIRQGVLSLENLPCGHVVPLRDDELKSLLGSIQNRQHTSNEVNGRRRVHSPSGRHRRRKEIA